ncbi:hypothetical protein CDD83_3129 [Cordyceps sp. RAO-2017]|nr:hypothetical protein CDD83_3129 [Cordyceps sp. RAO-2017]
MGPKNDRLGFILNWGIVFDTLGKNLTGPNNLIIYDLEENRVHCQVDISKKFATVGRGGMQDLEFDEDGNVFVIETYGGILLRVSSDCSTVEEWYKDPLLAPTAGFTGLARVNDIILLVDQTKKKLYRTRTGLEGKGKAETVEITGLHPNSAAQNMSVTDGLYCPPKYAGNCCLLSDNDIGTTVFWSDDGWFSAKIHSPIPNKFLNDQPRGSSTASVEMAGRIFVITEWFMDGAKAQRGAGKPGDRTEFPMQDITALVDERCKPNIIMA